MTPEPVTGQPSGEATIRTRPQPNCYVCGRAGQLLYQGLRDRLYSAPGSWNLVRCPAPDCGLGWLDPMPAEDDVAKAYTTYYTHPGGGAPPSEGLASPAVSLGFKTYLAVTEGYLGWRYGYPATRWERVLAPLIYLRPAWKADADFSVFHQPSPRRRLSLLDVGCGDGTALHRMAQLGWEVHGIDIDPRAVARARERGLDVRLGSLDAQRYPASTFDVVTMSHVIEHVHDPGRLLEECRRILKPRGTLVVYTPNLESNGHSIFKDAWRGLEPPRHLYLFNGRNLRLLVERTGGWRIEALRTTVRGASAIFSASEEARGQWRRNAFLKLELASLRFRPTRGEELLLIAERTG